MIDRILLESSCFFVVGSFGKHYFIKNFPLIIIMWVNQCAYKFRINSMKAVNIRHRVKPRVIRKTFIYAMNLVFGK